MTGQVTHCVPVLIAVIIRKGGLKQSNNNDSEERHWLEYEDWNLEVQARANFRMFCSITQLHTT